MTTNPGTSFLVVLKAAVYKKVIYFTLSWTIILLADWNLRAGLRLILDICWKPSNLKTWINWKLPNILNITCINENIISLLKKSLDMNFM